MNHLKGYATVEEAARSKAGQADGAVIDDKCPCKRVHVVKPKAAKALAVAEVPAVLRAKPGAMTSAVRLVLAGEANVAQAARDFEVDEARLEAAAGRAFRRAVMERDHWTCRHCGAMATEVQHIIARGMGGTADPRVAFGMANGVGLCARSHRLAEARDPGMYDLGFWRWQGEVPGAAPIYAAAEYGRERLWLLPTGEASRTDQRKAAA